MAYAQEKMLEKVFEGWQLVASAGEHLPGVYTTEETERGLLFKFKCLGLPDRLQRNVAGIFRESMKGSGFEAKCFKFTKGVMSFEVTPERARHPASERTDPDSLPATSETHTPAP